MVLFQPNAVRIIWARQCIPKRRQQFKHSSVRPMLLIHAVSSIARHDSRANAAPGRDTDYPSDLRYEFSAGSLRSCGMQAQQQRLDVAGSARSGSAGVTRQQ
jgi:hypothetical protein